MIRGYAVMNDRDKSNLPEPEYVHPFTFDRSALRKHEKSTRSANIATPEEFIKFIPGLFAVLIIIFLASDLSGLSFYRLWYIIKSTLVIVGGVSLAVSIGYVALRRGRSDE
jgi:hypothetical protein